MVAHLLSSTEIYDLTCRVTYAAESGSQEELLDAGAPHGHEALLLFFTKHF